MEKKIIEYLKNLYNIEKTIYEEEAVRSYLVDKKNAPVSYYSFKEVNDFVKNDTKKAYFLVGIYFAFMIAIPIIWIDEFKEGGSCGFYTYVC